MYEYMADVIPVPRGTVAMRSKGASYKKDLNGIVYNVDKKIPKAELRVGDPFPEGILDDAGAAAFDSRAGLFTAAFKTPERRAFGGRD